MAQLPSLEQAQELKNRNLISEDSYNKIVELSPKASQDPTDGQPTKDQPSPSSEPKAGAAPEMPVESADEVQKPINQAINERWVPNYADEVTKPPQAIPATIARPVNLTTDPNTIDKQTPLNNQYNDMMANINKPYDFMQAAVLEGAKAGAAEGAEKAAALNKIQDDTQTRIRSDEIDRIKRQSELDDAAGKLQQKVDDVSNMKVDPNKFWANRQTGDKVLAGIALFLGAAGGVNGQGNTAVPVIQNAIKQDIETQKANIGIKQEGVAESKGLYAQMLNTYHDRDLAESATTAAYYKNAENQIQAIAAKYQGPESQAKAMQMLGQIEAERQKSQMDFMQRYQAMMPVTPETNVEMLPPEKRERTAPDYYGLAVSPKGAEELRTTYIPQAANATSAIDQLKTLAKKDWLSLPGPDKQKAISLLGIAVGAARSPLFGAGTYKEGEAELLGDILGDPTKFWSRLSSNVAKLDTVKEKVNEFRDNFARAQGFKTRDDVLGVQRAGNVSYKK